MAVSEYMPHQTPSFFEVRKGLGASNKPFAFQGSALLKKYLICMGPCRRGLWRTSVFKANTMCTENPQPYFDELDGVFDSLGHLLTWTRGDKQKPCMPLLKGGKKGFCRSKVSHTNCTMPAGRGFLELPAPLVLQG